LYLISAKEGFADVQENRRRRFLGTVAASIVAALTSFRASAYASTRFSGAVVSDQQIQKTTVVRNHQPDQAVFRSVLPEDIDWKPFPAFPPSVRLAVVVGQPSEPGPYVIRVKVPSHVKLMPHRHPEDRVYTVMSGVFYIGLGDQFDGDMVEAYPPGSVIVLPGDTSHFHWAKSGEYVTQVTAIGPLGLEYLDPRDDPRNR
jgi:quercetin dioxygenase-like cupin family protein